MDIHLVGLAASPRANGNSDILLRKSLEALRDSVGASLSYEIICLRDKKILPCLACNDCGKDKRTGEYMPCVQAQNDDVQEIIDKMLAADGIFLATPVYFGLPTDGFLTFANRLRVVRHQDFALANKPVGMMVVAGRRSGGGETAIMAGGNVFLRNGCLVLGNGGGTSQYGAIAWAGGKGEILNDDWGLLQGQQVAERVYSMARVVKAGLQTAGYAFPMAFSYSQGMPPKREE